MEDLLAKHRKEQKELQGRIIQKKKNATKKTRKGVNDECERLEQDLKMNQQTEIENLNSQPVEDGIANLDIQDPAEASSDKNSEPPVSEIAKGHKSGLSDPTRIDQDDSNQPQTVPKRPNRQKARLARRAAEQEAQSAAAAEEAANQPDLREQELSAMKSEMSKRHLIESLIRPDGHCMYSACALNLPSDSNITYQSVRTATADFISKHADDFSPFLEEPLDSYVNKIKNTAEWGGHLELQAIAKAYSVNINVLQANGQVEKVAPETPSEQDIWLAYYRHSFGLGEHYNALKSAEPG